MEKSKLECAMPWREWLETPAGHKTFPTKHGMAWFMRQNERQLVESGSLIKIRNQWHVVEPDFSEAVFEILQWNTLNRVMEVA